MEENSVISVQNLSEGKEREAEKRGGDRPSFWSYVFVPRKYGICKDRKTGKYYNVTRSNELVSISFILIVVVFMCVASIPLFTGYNSWDYQLDALVAAFLLILAPLSLIEYRLVKFQEIVESEMDEEDKRKLEGNRYKRIVLNIIILAIFAVILPVFAFLNSFSFNWLKSLNEDNKEAYLIEISVSGNRTELDRDARRAEIDKKSIMSERDSIAFRLRTERSPEGLRVRFNGKPVTQEDILFNKYKSFIWDSTYFVCEYYLYIDTDDFDEYNTLNITCGEVSNDYELVMVDNAGNDEDTG